MSDYVPHPFPAQKFDTCPSCQSPRISDVVRCDGKGAVLVNWGRYYQKCNEPSCTNPWVWLSPTTPLDSIPVDVQVRYAQRISAAEAAANSPDGLRCSNPDCLKAADQKPRRANQACSRQRCAPCCRLAGGCELPSHGRVQAASDTQAPSTSNGDPAPVQSTYARPMHDNVGHSTAWVDKHQKNLEANKRIELGRRMDEKLGNSVNLHVWSSAGEPFQRLKVTSPRAGKITLEDCALFLSSFDEEFFSVFTPNDERTAGVWVTQELSTPIIYAVVRPFILIRKLNLNDEDCLGLMDEVSVFITGKVAPRATAPVIVAPAIDPLQPLSERLIKPLPFPLTYVCDMVTGMERLEAACGEREMQQVFSTFFAGSKFVRSTVFRTRAVYTKGKRLGVLDEFIMHGQTPNGRWSAFTKATEAFEDVPESAQDSSSPSSQSDGSTVDSSASEDSTATAWSFTAAAVSPPATVIAASGPAVPVAAVDVTFSWDIPTVRLEHFTVSDEGEFISSYEAAHDNLKVLMQIPAYHVGAMMEVYYVHLNGDSNRPFAFKMVRKDIPPFKDDAAAISGRVVDMAPTTWAEVARMENCRGAINNFLGAARANNVNIEKVEVLQSYFVVSQSGRSYYVGQPWVFGIPYGPGIPRCVDALRMEAILAAFTHYAYSQSGGRDLYIDFQGFFFPGRGVRIYDCRAHTHDNSRSYSYIGDDGTDAIRAFATAHVCNDICKALNLPANLAVPA